MSVRRELAIRQLRQMLRMRHAERKRTRDRAYARRGL
jgi:hypothetical protein